MIFNQRTVQKLEVYTKKYSTIIYSKYTPDSIYLTNDTNVNIDRYINNSFNSKFFIFYSKKIFDNNNQTYNIQNLIPNAKMIPIHMLKNIKNCFIDSGFVPDLDNENTKKNIIINIDNQLTLHNTIKENLEIIFKHIPTRHYAGAKGTKSRIDFEENYNNNKDIVNSLDTAIKYNLERISHKYFKNVLFNDIIFYLRQYIRKYLTSQIKLNTIDNISSPINIKNQKNEIIISIVNILTENDYQIKSKNKDEAIKYFTNIYRVVKFNKLYESTLTENRAISNFVDVKTFADLESIIDVKVPDINSGISYELSW